MVTDDERLRQILQEFDRLEIPKLGDAHTFVSSADIDLYEEEANVHIAARYYLKNGNLGKLSEIVFDPTIDQRLEDPKVTDAESQLKIDALKLYHRKLRELIDALARASGVRMIPKAQLMAERGVGAPPRWPLGPRLAD